MRMVDIIEKKKSGETLLQKEIAYVIEGYTEGTIPDYQVSALLMAIWFNGMDERETTDITMAMAASGDSVDLSGINGIKVDKHSTGGVADTTTLIAGPLAAACGVKVAKMSGRGLGHTGGTLDKLEAIPNFSVNRGMDQFVQDVSHHGFSVIGQTKNLVPADKKLYALRDVTATVDNISLIAGSIMSKKLASGGDAVLLDVKTGSGAFMKTEEEAVELASLMVRIGKLAGRKTEALVTDMNQPLGNAVGNALEVKEAIEILRGEYAGDLLSVSFALAGRMLLLGGQARTEEEAREALERALKEGRALETLGKMIEAQGGDKKVLTDTGLLPGAKEIIPLVSEENGFLNGVNASEIGRAAQMLGAGRERKEDTIDHAVGLWMKKRLGEEVRKGETLAEMHVNSPKFLEDAAVLVQGAMTIGKAGKKRPPLIYKTIQ